MKQYELHGFRSSENMKTTVVMSPPVIGNVFRCEIPATPRNGIMATGNLRVIPGGLPRQARIGGVMVAVSTKETPPFPIKALVMEDDTYQVLSAPPFVEEPLDHPNKIMSDLIDFQPGRHGSVVCRGNVWLALVHDLDREPTCDETVVRSCLGEIFELAAQKKVGAFGMPPLGGVHGKIPEHRALSLIFETLRHREVRAVHKMWIVVSSQMLRRGRQLLGEFAD